MKLTKKERSWALYDVANSAFALILTAIIPIFFRELVNQAGIESLAHNPVVNFFFHDNVVASLHGSKVAFESLKSSLYAFSTTIAVLIIAISATFIGSLADYENHKKKLFITTTMIGIIGCFLLGTTTSWICFLLYICVCRIAISISNIFYDSMLVDVTDDQNMDNLSSIGYAIGYIGSCIPFIVCILLILFKPFNLDSVKAAQISFMIIALWWLVFSLPLFKNYRQIHFIPNCKHKFKHIINRLKNTLSKIRKKPKVATFILAYFCYIDGVYTIMSMATTYGAEVGLNSNDMIVALLVAQIVAFPCALICGKLTKKFDTLKIIKILIIMYIGIALYAYQMDQSFEFWVLCFLVGMAQGGIQALSRSYFASMIPKEEASEYFGFFDIFGKFADFLGPLIMTVCISLFGQSKYGIFCLIFLFLTGLWLLRNKKQA